MNEGALATAVKDADPRQRLGLEGETRAEAALRDKGFRILARRWRCRIGEIDLIAEDGPWLVFVEVKARAGEGFGWPAEAVDRRKRGRLARVALAYLQAEDALERPCRFDVVEVGDDVRHIEDAFRPGSRSS